MNTPAVVLHSITGVDIELRIAGPGSRSYAFVIDWHIRLVLALAWWFAGLIFYGAGLSFFMGEAHLSSAYYLTVVVPALVIYFLYHPILEVLMRGRTPGKRIAGVRLVSRSGDIPSIGALLLRNVFRLIDSLPFVYLVGLATVMFTAQHVRVGDLAAGTLLVMDGSEHDKSLASLAPGSTLDPQVADLVQELLDRWKTLDEATRTGLARSLLLRIDPQTAAPEVMQLSAAQLHERLKSLLTSQSA